LATEFAQILEENDHDLSHLASGKFQARSDQPIKKKFLAIYTACLFQTETQKDLPKENFFFNAPKL